MSYSSSDITRDPAPPDKKAGLFESAIKLAMALAFGETVSPEVVKARFEICKECPKAVVANKGAGANRTPVLQCSICGCKSGPNDKTLINLARFKETPGKKGMGCHFYGGADLPNRSKWARAGL